MSNQTIATEPNIEVAEVRIGGFADLPARKGLDYTYSPEFVCLGHKWRLRIYPGGKVGSSHDGNVAVFLYNMSDESIKVQCTLLVKQSTTKIAAYLEFATLVYQAQGDARISWGDSNFAERTVLLGALEQGALVIKVDIRQPDCSSGRSQSTFVPGNPIAENIMKMFNQEECSDVVFEVSCEGDEESCESSDNRAKTAPTKFYAHRLILKDGAPTLFDLTGSGDGSLIRIPITDVKPAIFECLLRYVYGGKVEDEDMKNNAKVIIDAADKYNVVNLKLEAEASLVSTTDFTVDNVLDFLLYADEKNCALLKEATMDFLVKNRSEVQKKVSFRDAPSDLMTDLLAAMEMDDSMRVGNLRKRLHGKGLDVDGSRQAMIARLEESA